MKILTLHSDFIEFQAKKKAFKQAEEDVVKDLQRMEECLVVFTAVEKVDESNVEGAVNKYISEIEKVLVELNVKNIVLYPYAHLSKNLSSPKVAEEVMKKAEAILAKKFEVKRAPFGWYKSFNISCKGHPLSELSREFGPEEVKENDETESLKKERKLTSYWHILDTEGELHDISKFNYGKNSNLKKLASYEKSKERNVVKEPPHIKLMKRLELVDYEPASDGGNLRYYPKGRLIKKLLEDYVTDRVVEYGGVEVETPIMYDINHPTLSKYLQRFPARQYQIESDKRTFFLRFAACFGQFLMAKDATISYKNLPLRLYEMSRYSFRREQSGELSGLRRLRAFTMPDVHALCADMKQSMVEYNKRFELSLSVLKGIGFESSDVEMALRTTKDFFKENKEELVKLVKKLGKPVLLELWDEKIFYFVLKYEFNFIDNMNKASALSTDQLDIENGERYGIEFTNKEGEKKTPLILHCSPSGAIERVMWALLEKAAKNMNEGRVAQLPLWLNPTQVRVIPVTEEFNEFSTKIMNDLCAKGIRADIDDRSLKVGKKIRTAGMDWSGIVLVLGEKEKDGNFSVRIRGEKYLKEMTQDELISYVKNKTEGMPFKPLPLPKELSKRCIFVG